MLFLADWAAFIAFWFYIIRIARLDGARLPIIFVSLWLLAYLGFPYIGIEGVLYFTAFEALLTLVLIFVDLYRNNSNARRPRENPLEDLNH